ncbi:MAG: GNAT family N-acetyltransferase [Pseudomonadota bacterium]
MITWSETPPEPAEYVAMRAATGLGARTLEAAKIGLAGGLFATVARDPQGLAAMARLVGDGGAFVQLVDVMVRADLGGQGLGREVVARCLAWAEAHLPVSCLVGLHTDPTKIPFYAAHGFREDTGMLLHIGDRR